MTSPLDLLAFIHRCGKLKQIKRTGWLRHNITEPESVADHSWRLAVMTMMIGSNMPGLKPNLDVAKMVKMALIHDLAEISTGDITPSDGIKREDKIRIEDSAMKKILIDVDENGELYKLWDEYNSCSTTEAKIVNELDKLEMACQAVENESGGTSGLEEFYTFDPEEFDFELINDIYMILKDSKSS